MKKLSLFLICTGVVIICCGVILAQAAETKAIESGKQVMNKTVLLPDLIIKSVDFYPVPKENELIGLVKISVVNQGAADAATCTLGLSCVVAKCNEGNKCEETSRLIRANITVPALKKGQILDLEWKPASPIEWVSGKYSVVAEIDKYNTVQESNETNNVSRCMILITSLSPRASTGK